MNKLHIASIAYFIFINIISFILFGVDKRKAIKGQWRISEFTLFASSFLGGFFGAILGMKIFRHKTKHLSFLILIPLSAILWFYLIYYVFINKVI